MMISKGDISIVFKDGSGILLTYEHYAELEEHFKNMLGKQIIVPLHSPLSTPPIREIRTDDPPDTGRWKPPEIYCEAR